MTDPRQLVALTPSAAPAQMPAANFAPEAGRNALATHSSADAVAGTDAPALDEAAVVTAVVQALATIARAGAADTATSVRAAVALHDALTPWLESQLFLAVVVSRRGFGRAPATLAMAADLAMPLAAAGVLALVFKRGVTIATLETWVGAFAAATSLEPEAIASRLWAVDGAGVGVRWRDEGAFDDGASLDEWSATSGADAAGLDEHQDLVRAFDAGPADGEPPPETDWRRLVTLAASERERLRGETIETAAMAACRYGRLVVTRAETARDPAARADAAQKLADFVATLVQQRRFTWLRDLLAQVRPTAADVDAVWLQPLLAQLCAEHNVLILGEILEDRAANPADVTAIREVLGRLPRAVEHLAALLATMEPARSRRLVCLVLAAVAAHDPSLLVQNAVGQTWYVVRNIAFVLGRIGDASVVPHLARWARHDDERVRIEVARALGRVRAPGASDVLCALLDDRDARVRQCAVWSLAAAEDTTALTRLRQRLFDDKEFRDRPAEERDDFFRTYGRLADDATFAELVRLVSQRPRLGFGWGTELRRGAALALGESGRVAAAESLRAQATSRDSRLRDAVQAALATLETGPRAPRLVDEDDWCEPARIGNEPNPATRFHLEAEDV